MQGVNRITLIGTVGRTTFRKTNNGTPMFAFELTVRERVPRAGDWIDHEETFVCTIGGARAEHFNKAIAELDAVYVEGAYRARDVFGPANGDKPRQLGEVQIREAHVVVRSGARAVRR